MKDQSGPAFPNNSTEWSNRQEGMTKRELIAMHALQGLLASDVHATAENFATRSVACADALLAELGRE